MVPTRHPRPRRGVRTLAGPALASLSLLAALTACGDDTATPGTEPSASADDTTAAAPKEPACDAVWVAGEDLPRDYSGCVDADGDLVEPEIVACSSGQRIVTHDDRWWAVRGHRIGHAPDGLKDNPDYKKVLRSCRA